MSDLHRPDHLNAYSSRMGVELGDAAVEAQPNEGLAGMAGFSGSMKEGAAWM